MTPGDFPKAMASLAGSVRKSTPMFWVPDMRATVSWYESMGFTVADRHEDEGELVFARLTFGSGELTLTPGATVGPREVKLWFFTDRVLELYQLCKSRSPALAFDEELYEPFYGGHQFSVCDINGLSLVFWQPAWLGPVSSSGAES